MIYNRFTRVVNLVLSKFFLLFRKRSRIQSEPQSYWVNLVCAILAASGVAQVSYSISVAINRARQFFAFAATTYYHGCYMLFSVFKASLRPLLTRSFRPRFVSFASRKYLYSPTPPPSIPFHPFSQQFIALSSHQAHKVFTFNALVLKKYLAKQRPIGAIRMN